MKTTPVRKSPRTSEVSQSVCSLQDNKNPDFFHANNRIIPLDELSDGIESSLCCQKCVKRREEDDLLGLVRAVQGNKMGCGLEDLVKTYISNKDTRPYPKIKTYEHTVGIDTSIICECPKHGTLFPTQQTKTKFSKEGQVRDRLSGYLMNHLLVLAVQSFGGGGTEAERILSFLGLPHAPSFGKYSFHHLESSLGPLIQDITQTNINEALEEEITKQLLTDGTPEMIRSWKNG